MTNRVRRPRAFAWMIGGSALRSLGDYAREQQRTRRDEAAEAKKEGRRVERPLHLTREDHNAARRKARGW